MFWAWHSSAPTCPEFCCIIIWSCLYFKVANFTCGLYVFWPTWSFWHVMWSVMGIVLWGVIWGVIWGTRSHVMTFHVTCHVAFHVMCFVMTVRRHVMWGVFFLTFLLKIRNSVSCFQDSHNLNREIVQCIFKLNE